MNTTWIKLEKETNEEEFVETLNIEAASVIRQGVMQITEEAPWNTLEEKWECLDGLPIPPALEIYAESPNSLVYFYETPTSWYLQILS